MLPKFLPFEGKYIFVRAVWRRMPPLDFFGPLILIQDIQGCPHLKGVGGGWLSAWVLWTELKLTRMPVVPGEHARTWTKSLQ